MGHDAGKKVKGRKIHALVDTEGLPMRVVAHSAAIQDRDGAELVLARARHGLSGGVGSRCKRSRTAIASRSRCWEYR